MKNFFVWLKESFEPRLAATTMLVAAFVGLLFTLAVFRPLFHAWRVKVAQVEVQQRKLMRHERLISQKDAFLEELERYEVRFRRRNSHDEEVASFLNQLEHFSNNAGLRLNNIRPVANREQDNLDVMIIELTVEGEMGGLVGFLHEMASSEDLIDVRTMSILRRRSGGGNLAITAEITKTLFVK